MPVLFWIDVSALSLSIIIACSLAMLVMVVEPGRLLNLSFALFSVLAASFALLSLSVRLALWLDKGSPRLLLELAILAFGLMSVMLLNFSARYVQRCGRGINAATVLGAVLVGVLSVPLFRHRMFDDLRLLPNGSTTTALSGLGLAAAVVPLSCLAGSLFLLWRHRRASGEPYTRFGVLVLLGGLVFDGVIELPVPLLSAALLVGVAVLGYGIVRRRFLNPQRERALELKSQVEIRTRELATAYAEVEQKIEVRTAALQVEIAERSRAEEALRQRARRLELLGHVGQSTAAVLELDELLRLTVRLLSDTFGYYNAAVFLAQGEMLVLRASSLPELQSGEVQMFLRIGREGVCGWVAASGEPAVVPDVSRDARYVARTKGLRTRSEIAVPIRLKGDTVGVLDVQSTELEAFSPLDLFTLQAVGDQLAIAIENARLYEETRRRAERLALVNRVAAAVGASLELDKLLQTVYREISPIFQADAFFVALYAPDTEELDFRIQIDEGVAEAPARQPLGSGLSSVVIREQKPLLIADWSAARERLPEPQVWGSMKSPVSWLGVPLKMGSRLTGIISVQTYQQHHYGNEDLLLLSTIADQVAVAVERARLYEAVQQELAERRRAEEVLRESEEQFRNLAEQSPNMIFINTRGRVVYANRKCEEIMGYARSEFYDPEFDFLTLIAPEDRPTVKAAFSRHLGGEEVPPYEYTLLTKEGRRLEVIITSKLIRYLGQGALLGIITDITVRKRTERLLRTLNAASLAVESAESPEEIFITVGAELKKLGYDSVVFLIDPQRTHLGLKYCSYSAEAIRSIEDLTGGKVQEFSAPLQADLGPRKVAAQRESVLYEASEAVRVMFPPELREQSEEIARTLGLPRSISAPLIVEDEVIGAMAVQSDDLTHEDIPAVTAFANQLAAAWRKARLMEDLKGSLEELERTQEQLVQAQKMEAIGKLAGGIAHDFNNLLTAIKGYTDLLLRDPPEDPRRKSDLLEIKRAADHAAALTRQLLAFSRKQLLRPRILALNEVPRKMENMLRRLIGEDVELLYRLDPEAGSIKADPAQIEQVILNLAVNARDAMPEGGRLVLESRNVELREADLRDGVDVKPGRYVLLTMSDTGAGMDRNTLSHVFEPFFTTKEYGKGTGLGLATVYGIVKQSGGHIWVESEPGRGTTVRIVLPRVASPASSRAAAGSAGSQSAAPPASGPPVPGGGDAAHRESASALGGTETVLVVEDEEMVRELACRVLRQHGYTVIEASQAREALRIAARGEQAIDLVVTDVIMPGGMSGRQLGERLAESRPGLKVLFISGYTDDASFRRDDAAPRVPFLQKPFATRVLVQAVRQLLDGKELSVDEEEPDS